MYNNPYYNNQINLERIDNQIKELENMRTQIQRGPQPAINQTFQLAPTTQNIIRYASSIDEVKKEGIVGDTPFFSKDMSIVWIKSLRGEIRTYELNEIVPKDEKDMQIELLQSQINELRKEMRRNEQFNKDAVSTETSTDTKWYDEATGEPIEEDKSSGVQRVSTSKEG